MWLLLKEIKGDEEKITFFLFFFALFDSNLPGKESHLQKLSPEEGSQSPPAPYFGELHTFPNHKQGNLPSGEKKTRYLECSPKSFGPFLASLSFSSHRWEAGEDLHLRW